MIENLDCLEFLSKIPDDSIDLVLTDPPYFIGFDGGKGWDKQWKSEKEYLEWCEKWTRECVRVLKPERMLIVWGTLKTDAFLKYKLMLSGITGMVSQNEIIWSYNWGGRSKSNFARKHEYAWCYSKGHTFLFNDEEIRVERKLKKNIRTGEDYTQGTIPTCVWEKNNHTTSKDFCGWHPTTKNLDILERMVKAYTIEGDMVLDIFMGSGSTAIAAKRANRLFIGCEKDEEYFSKLQERVALA
jgi:site-specific DNA-methyltransferase (adenine-specific)